MKKLRNPSRRIALPAIAVLLGFLLSGCTAPVGNFPAVSDLRYKPIQWVPAEPERRVLKNGLVLYLLEDHELPVIHISATIRVGSEYEPADKVGLASLTGSTMRTGGTESFSVEEMDDTLEFLGAGVESSIGMESGQVSMGVLRKDLDTGLRIFADVLRRPVFRQNRVDLAKSQAIEGIRRRNDHPERIAQREFARLIYGDHPNGRMATVQSIRNITRQDMIDFHRLYYRPRQIFLGIAGDFQTEEMVAQLSEIFSNWEAAPVAYPPVPPVPREISPSVNVINKEGGQATVVLGHLGVRFNNPDLYALRVMNHILGGSGLNSRLMREIRSDRGLAYTVGSSLGAGVRDLGTFRVAGGTKPQTATEMISLMIKNLRDIQKDVKPEEVEAAKEAIINSFLFTYTSKSAIVAQQIFLEFHDLPRDYMRTYPGKIARVTREDVLRVAKQYLHPDHLIILVVGDEKKFDRSLSQFGTARTIRPDEP